MGDVDGDRDERWKQFFFFFFKSFFFFSMSRGESKIDKGSIFFSRRISLSKNDPFAGCLSSEITH